MPRSQALGGRALLGLALVLSTVFSSAASAGTRNLTVAKAAPDGQKRVALVIGNSEYQDVPRLANPVNDAKSMAESLSRLGFEVTEVTNATQKEMNRALSAFGERLTPNTVALFYFAGHGLQVKGRNFLVPVDAQITGEASISSESVDMEHVLDKLVSSTLSIVILDACRNNPYQRARSIGAGGLAQMDAPKGSFIAYATSPGKTASDGSSGNGLYTRELLKQMMTPGISLEDVFKRVRSEVALTTADVQIPWESTSLTGNFYFNGEPPRASSQVDPKELALWESVKRSSNPKDYDAYLARYPQGQFAAVARSAKSALEEAKRRSDEEQRRLEIAKARMEQERQLQLEEDKKLRAERLEESKRLAAEKAKLESDRQEVAERDRRAQIEAQARKEQLERMEQLLGQGGRSKEDSKPARVVPTF